MSRLSLPLALTLLATPAAATPPVVVADIAPVHSLVAQVMGDLGAPVLLVGQGGDPHAFQLRPSQARALAGAGLLFWIGPELTPWLERAVEGTGLAGDSVPLLHAPGTRTRDFDGGTEGEEHHEHGHGHGHDHAAGSLDPHAWLDPANAAAWLTLIADRLSAADPENAATYAANAARARDALATLDSDIRARLAPAAGRPLFVYHDAYGYFAGAYGLTVAGALAEGDAAAPGAAGMQAMKAAVAAADRPCLFAEAGHDPATMAALAEGTGLTPGVLDPEGVGLAPGPGLYAALIEDLAGAIGSCRD